MENNHHHEQEGANRPSRTVRDFKNFLRQRLKVSSGGDPVNPSEKYGDFWKKLNNLGARNIESQPPESVTDIDNTVTLTDEEWARLEEELNRLG